MLISKFKRRFPGFDEKIVAMYARGMGTRYIQAHIEELYGIGVSAALISVVTGSVLQQLVYGSASLFRIWVSFQRRLTP